MKVRSPPGVLGAIVARTLQHLPRGPFPERSSPLRAFTAALRAPGLSLIAEVKPRSPSMGILQQTLNIERLTQAYAAHASVVSVLVDQPSFGGSLALLKDVRERVPCPVLAKGFFVHELQLDEAWSAGADAVLLMASILPPERLGQLLEHARGLGLGTLVEAHDDLELREVLQTDAPVVGVNSRDLRTLAIDLDAAVERLAGIFDRVRVAESGIGDRASIERVRPVADAVLIGTALMRAPNPTTAIRALGFSPCR